MVSVVRRTRVTTIAGGRLTVWAPNWYSTGTVVAYALDSNGSRGQEYYANLAEYQNGSGTEVMAAVFSILPPGNYEVENPRYSCTYRKVTVFPGSEADVDFR